MQPAAARPPPAAAAQAASARLPHLLRCHMPPHVRTLPGLRALVQCGWCAAVNAEAAANGAAPSTPDSAAPRLQLAGPRACRRPPLSAVAGRALVAAVFTIVGSIFVIGVGVVQPAVLGESQLAALHVPLAILLAFNILFNYTACIIRPAGPVSAHLRSAAVDAAGRVRRGGLEGCRYCEACAYYKPPAAHHCRSCGCCVVELDHHCWYINNCAGAANLRHFLLFLGWLVAAVAYGLAFGLAMGWRDWESVAAHTRRVMQNSGRLHPALRLPSFSLYWLFSAPRWLACWAYFTVVCWAALLAVGALLFRQLCLLLRGRTHLQVLQARRQGHLQQQQQQQQLLPGWQMQQAAEMPTAAVVAPLSLVASNGVVGTATEEATPGTAAAAGADGLFSPSAAAAAEAAAAGAAHWRGESAAMRNARRVFGGGHPLTWLLPAWQVPAWPDGPTRAKLQ